MRTEQQIREAMKKCEECEGFTECIFGPDVGYLCDSNGAKEINDILRWVLSQPEPEKCWLCGEEAE